MKIICEKCKRPILFNPKKYVGKNYCADCYDKICTTPACSAQSRWLMRERQFGERGPYKFTIKIVDNNYFFDIVSKKNAEHICMHKLFTYKYDHTNSYSLIMLNTIDGEPFLVSFGYDSGADGDGEWIYFEKIDYQLLISIIKRKSKTINTLFCNLTPENWKDYLTVTYVERQTDSRAYFVAQILADKTRIAISKQNPNHAISYIICRTDKYIEWKKNHADLFDCLCDYEGLRSISTEFITKSHSPFKTNKYSFFIDKKPESSGNIDVVISMNRSTELYEFDSVFIDNASSYVDLIENGCK